MSVDELEVEFKEWARANSYDLMRLSDGTYWELDTSALWKGYRIFAKRQKRTKTSINKLQAEFEEWAKPMRYILTHSQDTYEVFFTRMVWQGYLACAKKHGVVE